jgi:DNA repair protein RecO
MDAIVLSRRDIREYDQMLVLFTKEHGRRDVLLRSSKKIVSKNAPHCESGSLVDVSIVSGKEIDHATKVVPITQFPQLYSDPHRLLLVKTGTTVFEKMVTTQQKDETLFRLLLSFIVCLNAQVDVSSLYVDAFVLQLLSVLGYSPVFDHCVVHQEIHSTVALSYTDGGMICVDALDRMVDKRNVVMVSKECVSAFNTLLTSSWATPPTLQYSPVLMRQIHEQVHALVQYRSEKRISSWNHVDALFD